MTRGVLVHEWLARAGGSENVFEAMAEVFPDADLLCLWNDHPERFGSRAVAETWLGRTGLRRNKTLALPLMPGTWRGRRPGGYDWALVSSHLFAHHVTFAATAPHFRKYVFVHSPARYIWNPELDARGAGLAPRMVAPALRTLDRARAQEAHAIAANSRFVQQRIRQAWHRDSVVIYPPVQVERIQQVPTWSECLDEDDAGILGSLPETFLLGASRFIQYKRLDLVIEAGEASGLPVVLAGSGPLRQELAALAARASVPVVIVEAPSDTLLFALYERALALVFLAVEDFGIVPVEAMAAGAPVIARRMGGVAETVQDSRTGVLVDDVGRASLRRAVEQVTSLDRDAPRHRARDFSAARFGRELRGWMAEELS
ncbi:glycosyltransferase [Georgenia sp. SYP-B2076]|uniref:glycosyltransferase n=1 Tax=Georgenia sp. SYP-B2076 TaxID=2495881 RepID=UPI000F8E6175|nr:glycosyltransferase [Georgenia sp. SYP-B2076]